MLDRLNFLTLKQVEYGRRRIASDRFLQAKQYQSKMFPGNRRDGIIC